MKGLDLGEPRSGLDSQHGRLVPSVIFPLTINIYKTRYYRTYILLQQPGKQGSARTCKYGVKDTKTRKGEHYSRGIYIYIYLEVIL